MKPVVCLVYVYVCKAPERAASALSPITYSAPLQFPWVQVDAAGQIASADN